VAKWRQESHTAYAMDVAYLLQTKNEINTTTGIQHQG